MITSEKNLKIREYLNLLNNKAYRIKTSKFVLEGIRLIYDGLVFGAKLDIIFITEENLIKIKNSKFNIILKNGYELISNKIAKKLKQVSHSQNIFAISNKPAGFKLSEIDEFKNLLALYKISDPGNLGTLLRSACAFGFNGVILSEDCCEIYNPKVIRSSMGAVFKVKILECSNFGQLLEFINSKKFEIFASVVEKTALNIKNIKGRKGMLIIGSEAFGLPNEVLEKCKKITIKMSNCSESLNAAIAGSILMYELSSN